MPFACAVSYSVFFLIVQKPIGRSKNDDAIATVASAPFARIPSLRRLPSPLRRGYRLTGASLRRRKIESLRVASSLRQSRRRVLQREERNGRPVDHGGEKGHRSGKEKNRCHFCRPGGQRCVLRRLSRLYFYIVSFLVASSHLY